MICQRKRSPIFTLVILVAMAAIPKPSVAAFVGKALQPSTATATLATATDASSPFALPSAVPSGTAVKINGSGAMTGINQALKQSFEKKYTGTVVTVAESGADAAIQAVAKGEADLAAIGRPLTADEMALGLVETAISRNKIAIIVGADSPFQGTLTLDQFAKIYSGEITDWSQISSGASGSIRAIDHPVTSDTRQAFNRYPSFPNGLQAGAETVKLEKDSIQTIAESLGTDGVSYAIASQALTQPGVRALSMYDTLPDDPRYPFSQPLMYVYKGPNPNPAVAAFLGFATAPENQQMVEGAKGGAAKVETAKAADGNPLTALLNAVLPSNKTESNQAENKVEQPAAGSVVATSPAVVTAPAGQPGTASKPDAGTTTALVPSADSSAGTATSGLPGWLWWLLPLGLGGFLLGWLMKDRPREDEWETVIGDRPEGRPGYDASPSLSGHDSGYGSGHDAADETDRSARWSAPGAELVAGATDRVSETVHGAANTVGDAASNVVEGAGNVVSNATEAGKGAIAGGTAIAAGAGATVMGGLGALLGRKQQTPDVPSSNVGEASGRGMFGGIADKIGDGIDGAKQKAGSVASGVGDAIADGAANVASGAGNVVAGARDAAGNVASNVTDATGNVVSGARDAAGDVISGVGNVVSGARDATAQVGQGGSNIASNLKDVASSVSGQTVEGVGRVKDAAGNWIEAATEAAQESPEALKNRAQDRAKGVDDEWSI